jgi:hypothetical protein
MKPNVMEYADKLREDGIEDETTTKGVDGNDIPIILIAPKTVCLKKPLFLIDALVESGVEEVVELTAGYLGCSLSGEVLDVLEVVTARQNEFDRLVIETTGPLQFHFPPNHKAAPTKQTRNPASALIFNWAWMFFARRYMFDKPSPFGLLAFSEKFPLSSIVIAKSV